MAVARLLIVDDHPVVRQGMARLIGQYDGLDVADQASGAEEGLRLLREEPFDLVVVDLALQQGISGLELIKRVRAEFDALPVIVLTMQDRALYEERARRAGASGFVTKQEPVENVVDAARAALGPEEGSGARPGDPEGPKTNPTHALSDRELEVFHLLGEGQGTRGVAEALSVSPKTVESHRANIKRKLGLADATALIQRAALWVQRSRS
jgi:DNA-binding NarL/FixJ family response regulator